MALTGKPGSDSLKRVVTFKSTHQYVTLHPPFNNSFILGEQIPHI